MADRAMVIFMVNPIIARKMTQTEKDYDCMFKVVLVGQSSVGKSSILLRFSQELFHPEYQMTLGVEYAVRTVTTQKGNRIKLQIWDTMGQEKYKSLMRVFYKGSSAVLVVYDITKQDTFQAIDKEIETINNFAKNEPITMIVGNKTDMEEDRVVSKQKGLDYAEGKKLAYYEVSAKEGTNVTFIFQQLAEELERAAISPSPSEVSTPSKKIQSVDKPDESPVVLEKTKVIKSQRSSQNRKCCN